jgi:Sin3 associated polypeptide p18 (SAP18)
VFCVLAYNSASKGEQNNSAQNERVGNMGTFLSVCFCSVVDGWCVVFRVCFVFSSLRYDATLSELTKLLRSASPHARRGQLSFSVVYLHPRGTYMMRQVTRGNPAASGGERTLKHLGIEAGDFLDVAVFQGRDRQGADSSSSSSSSSSRSSRYGGDGRSEVRGSGGGFLGGHGRFGSNRHSGGGGRSRR